MRQGPSAPTRLLGRREFVDGLREALERGGGYAAGRLSYSHVYRLSYRVLAERLRRPDLFLRENESRKLHFESVNQLGIYPADLAFYPRFDALWVHYLRNLDCVGVFPDCLDRSRRILDHYAVPGARVSCLDQEPDRSTPCRDDDCYLPLFRGKRVLLLCPFADLLRERARRDVFEAVWAKTGKRWFEPASVDAFEVPYGFARATQERYPTVIDLFESIRRGLDGRRFDVALVGAAGLAVPIVSHIKGRGRVAIDLGGHLQVLFGVLGKRWRGSNECRERYVND